MRSINPVTNTKPVESHSFTLFIFSVTDDFTRLFSNVCVCGGCGDMDILTVTINICRRQVII
jgi:hypothetical protein